MNLKQWFLAAALIGAIIAVGVLSIPYFNPALPTLATHQANWDTYDNNSIGVSIELPQQYRPIDSSDDEGTVFFFQGSPLVSISWLDKEAARGRGLWAGHRPVAEIEIGGLKGNQYIYNHYDALSGLRTYAYVVPLRSRFFAVEFRTRRVSIWEDLGLRPRREIEPGPVCERILASVRFAESAGLSLRQPSG